MNLLTNNKICYVIFRFNFIAIEKNAEITKFINTINKFYNDRLLYNFVTEITSKLFVE